MRVPFSNVFKERNVVKIKKKHLKRVKTCREKNISFYVSATDCVGYHLWMKTKYFLCFLEI